MPGTTVVMPGKAYRAEDALRVAQIYRWYDSQLTLLYVGISAFPDFRAKEHRHSWWRPWATSMAVDPTRHCRLVAEAWERWYIENEQPIFNVQYAKGVPDRVQGYLSSRGVDPDQVSLTPPRRGTHIKKSAGAASGD